MATLFGLAVHAEECMGIYMYMHRSMTFCQLNKKTVSHQGNSDSKLKINTTSIQPVDYAVDVHVHGVCSDLESHLQGSRLEQAFGHAFNCCVDESPSISEEVSDVYMHEQRITKSRQSDLFRSNVSDIT